MESSKKHWKWNRVSLRVKDYWVNLMSLISISWISLIVEHSTSTNTTTTWPSAIFLMAILRKDWSLWRIQSKRCNQARWGKRSKCSSTTFQTRWRTPWPFLRVRLYLTQNPQSSSSHSNSKPTSSHSLLRTACAQSSPNPSCPWAPKSVLASTSACRT